MNEKKMIMKKIRITSAVLALLLIAGLLLSTPVFADTETATEQSTAAKDETTANSNPNIVYVDSMGCNVNKTKFQNVQYLEATVATAGGISGEIKGLRTITFPYTDEFFTQPQDAFIRDLDKASFAMTLAGFKSKIVNNGDVDGLTSFYQSIGFSDIWADPYFQTATSDTATYAFATKKIGDTTVVAIVVCGAGYGKEWAGNMKVGNEARHEGFSNAALELETNFDIYINERNITGDIAVWVVGHSRSAAVANVVAADLTDRKDINRVYAYLTATPNTTKEPGNYQNIYSIIGKNDPVAKIPFADWGYKRYGVVLYTPSVETNSDYLEKLKGINLSINKLLGTTYAPNSGLDNKFRNLMGYACVLIPDSGTYANEYQDPLVAVMEQRTLEPVAILASQVIAGIANSLDVEPNLLAGFMGTIEELGSDLFLEDKTVQSVEGTWNEDYASMNNMVKEHLNDTYYAWIYSDMKDEEFLDQKTKYRIFSINGKVTIDIYNDKGYCETISTKDGYVYDIEKTDGTDDYTNMRKFSYEYEKEKLVVSIPQDEEYYLIIKSEKEQTVTFRKTDCSCAYLMVMPDDEYSLNLDKNEEFYVYLSDDSVNYETGDGFGEIVKVVADRLTISSLMVADHVVRDHISILEVALFTILFLVFLVLELLVCLILGLVRLILKKKRRKIPVLVLHLINMALFLLAALYFKKYVTAYPWASMGLKIIAYLFILTLSIKALKKEVRTTATILVNSCMIAVMAADCIALSVWYPKYTTFTLIIELVVATVLSVVAAIVWMKAVPTGPAPLPESDSAISPSPDSAPSEKGETPGEE